MTQQFHPSSAVTLNTKWTVLAGKQIVSQGSWRQYNKSLKRPYTISSINCCNWVFSELFTSHAADFDSRVAKIHNLRPLNKEATTSLGGLLSKWKPVKQFPVATNKTGSATISTGAMALLNQLSTSLTFLVGIKAVNNWVAGNSTLLCSSPQLVNDSFRMSTLVQWSANSCRWQSL